LSHLLVERLAEGWRKLGIFDRVNAAFDEVGFTDSYIDALGRPASQAKPKVIKDGVWGMIEVDPSSLRLLDAPIMQRMRWIKQLGLTYLTYPSAEHTRFIHSLGMYCVVSRFMDVLSRNPPGSSSPLDPFVKWIPTETHKRLVSHAAILHDIGHMPFSHVTESVMQSDGSLFRCGESTVEDFTLKAEDLLERPLKLAECMSLAIVLSPRFDKFYRNWVCVEAGELDAVKIAALIAGIEPEAKLTGIANIISGASIDADKIDYINRDAEACGIPAGVDLSRLFLRSSFLEVRPAELQRLRSMPIPPSDGEVVFVVNASGLDSIEEVGHARTTLYHRVYLHQTTRNAERLLAKAIFATATNASPKAALPELIDAFEVWGIDDISLLNKLATSSDPKIAKLGARIKFRQLPKRACAFGRSLCFLSIPIERMFPQMAASERLNLSKQIVGSRLDELGAKQLKGSDLRALEKEIAEESTKLAVVLGRSDDTSSPLEVVSVLPMPNVEANRSDCIILEHEQLTSTAASSVSDEQMEASDIVKSVGYVMSDKAWREITFVAARKVLYLRKRSLTKISFVPHSEIEIEVKAEGRILLDLDAVARRVSLNKEKVQSTLQSAARAGYFENCPRLVPVTVSDTKIDEIAGQLLSFNGQGNWRVSRQSIIAFLAQFPINIRDGMAELLTKIRLLDKAELVKPIRESLTKIDLKGGQGFITGFSPDSGNSVRTSVEHELSSTLIKEGWLFKKTIRDVISESNAKDTLVLVDDNVTSGSQAVCQFLAWSGVDESKWTAEQRSERGIERAPLSARDLKVLKSVRLNIVTALGTEEAGETLSSELVSLGLTKFEGLTFGEKMRDGVGIPLEIEKFLESVGTSALAWARFGATELSALDALDLKNCERDALGYRGAKALVTTLLSVPTGTLTPLWCPGFHNGEPWMPLLIRRGYLEKLVIS
jgi:deoxynucleoside triphosphate triphosphohydrolase SAMHD1